MSWKRSLKSKAGAEEKPAPSMAHETQSTGTDQQVVNFLSVGLTKSDIPGKYISTYLEMYFL